MVIAPIVIPLTAAFAAPAPAAPSAFPVPQFQGQGVGRTSLLFGGRSLNSDFDPADGHAVLGIDINVREPSGILGFEGGYTYAWGDGDGRLGGGAAGRAESTVHELWAGGRWTFDPSVLGARPYVGVGLSVLRGSFDVSALGSTSSDSSWALGVYAHGGLFWDIGDNWSAGVDLRALLSSPSSLQDDASFDYVQGGVSIGWRW